MNVTHIPSTPDDAARVPEQVKGVFGGSTLLATAGATLYIHGGGFEFTNPDLERLMAYRFSLATGRPALRVEYRLAPRHPYPAALEDVLAAYREVLAQGAPASRTLFIGESAGATLLLSALLALKLAGDPMPGGAVAISPLTDFTFSGASIDSNAGKDIIHRGVLHHVRSQYLAGADPASPPQSPFHGDLSGLPPLLIVAGTEEVLLDDARRFAEAASAAGGRVQLDVYQRMAHAFHAAILAPDGTMAPTARTFLERIAKWVSEELPAAT